MVKLPFFCLLLFVSFSGFAEQSLKPIAKPEAAPEFNLVDMEGREWNLEALKGRPAIINFWATWCAPCRAEMPSMERAWKQIENDGIQMLAINFGEDRETIETFLFEFPMTVPVVLDTNVTTSKDWPFRALPTTLILDPEGRIVYKAVGPREWDSKDLLDQIRALRN